MCKYSAFKGAPNSNYETREVVAMPACIRLTLCWWLCLLCVASFVNIQCFWSCISWLSFCIFCYVIHVVVSGIRGWPAHPLPKLYRKVLSRLAEYDDAIKEPLFQPCLGPPQLEVHHWICTIACVSHNVCVPQSFRANSALLGTKGLQLRWCVEFVRFQVRRKFVVYACTLSKKHVSTNSPSLAIKLAPQQNVLHPTAFRFVQLDHWQGCSWGK